MIFYGTKGSHLQSGILKSVLCPACATETNMNFSVFGRYVHVYWIPVVAMKKVVVTECNNCKITSKFKDLPVVIQEKYKRQQSLNEVKTPVWYFSGGVILLSVLAFAIYTGIQAKADEKIYIKNPVAGDVYRINIRENNHYTTAKVKSTTTDSVSIFVNEMETTGYSGIDEIDIEKNYKKFFNIARKDLVKMYDDSDIYQIDRN